MNERSCCRGQYLQNQMPQMGAIREDEQIGLEETPEEFIETLVSVFREAGAS